MAPRMATIGPFVVIGVATCIRRGSESPDLFAGIWKAFESHQERIQAVATGRVCYGVTFPTADENVTEYLAGMEVPAATPRLDGLGVRSIPGGAYAVWECPIDAIGRTYQHVFSTWLPSAAVQFDGGRPSFEQYPVNVPGEPVRLHIPVHESPGESRRTG
jgi:predicted transcriptional regulator YdeE